MSIFKKAWEGIYYYLDSLHAIGLSAKIEQFKFDASHDNIMVIYRLGRQKLLNKMKLPQFEKEYFEKVSFFDQHRLTKFSTLQNILKELFSEASSVKENFIRYIEEEAKNEQLF